MGEESSMGELYAGRDAPVCAGRGVCGRAPTCPSSCPFSEQVLAAADQRAPRTSSQQTEVGARRARGVSRKCGGE